MPYKSAKQRAFMHAQHPDIAKRWDAETGGKVVPTRKDGKSDMRRVKPAAKRLFG